MIVFWRYVGFNVVLYLAALQTIPKDLYEAATMDGAGRFQQFWFITLPSLRPMIYFGVTLSVIGGLQLFEEPFILTGGRGGSDQAGMTSAMYLYGMAFDFNDFGAASAMSWMLFAVVVLAGTSLLSLRATEELEQTVERTGETQQLLQQVSTYWGQIGDSEAHGMRYLITGRAEFLTEYRSVLGELDASLEALKRMTADDPVAAHLVEVLADDPFNPPLAAGEAITTGTLTRAFRRAGWLQAA